MPELTDSPLMQLKALCAEHGVYTLASLASFMEVQPGRSQQDVADRSKQSASSVGQWYMLYELHELIVRTGRGKGRILVTPRGEAFRKAAAELFRTA